MFLKYFLILVKKFGASFKIEMFWLFIASIIGGILELLGIAMIFPCLLVLTSSDTVGGKIVIEKISEVFPYLSAMQIALFLSILMIAIFLFKNIFMMICIKAQNDFARRFSDFINEKVTKKLLCASYTDLKSLTYGDKNTLLFSSVREISFDFLLRAVILFANAIVALFILSLLFYKFTLAAFLSTVFVLVFAYFENLFFKSKAKTLGDIEVELLSDYAKNVNSVIIAQKEISISNKQDYFVKFLTNGYKKITNNFSKKISYGNFPLYVTEIGVIFSFLIMMLTIVLTDDVTKAGIVSSLAVIALIVLRLVPQINKVLISLYAINISGHKVVWFLEKYDEISKLKLDEYKTKEKMKFENEIELKNVCFEYGNENGLYDINLKIKKGEFIGIIGASGAGKTTLADVISGVLPPLSGEILIDSNLITAKNLPMWQNNISFLPQEPVFFGDYILENIAFGEDEVDVEKAKASLKLAGLDIDINSKMELSIGQKHRVALARAYYKNFEVLILDEATSALDVNTENFVMENVINKKGEKTIIAIAHRLQTLKKCNRIIFLENGKIKDIGTFDELRNNNPEIDKMLKISSFD